MHIEGHVTCLPHQSDYYHPDLIRAADVVVGKAGYSTLAEVYHAGTPFGCVGRSGFRETDILEAFMAAHMPGRFGRTGSTGYPARPWRCH